MNVGLQPGGIRVTGTHALPNQSQCRDVHKRPSLLPDDECGMPSPVAEVIDRGCDQKGVGWQKTSNAVIVGRLLCPIFILKE